MKLIKKNRYKRDCGVVAAFNAASWCNLYQPYDKIEKIASSCGYNPDVGMYVFQFSKLMKKLHIPAKKTNARSLEEIESKIYLGKFFIFIYTPTGYDSGHAIIAFLDHKGNIRVINPDSERVTWDELAADINANGMKEFHIYEIPHRQLIEKAINK